MNYICLRNCYVGERLWKEGKVYDLPDSMEIHPKNFRLVGEAPAPEPVTSKSSPIRPDVIPDGQYWCSKCLSLHRETSKIGKKHLK